MANTSLALPFSPDRLRKLRELAGLNQQGLADRTAQGGRSVSRGSISHFEIGTRPPSAPALKALADALDVPVDELLEDDA